MILKNRSILVCSAVTPKRINPPVAGSMQRTCADCSGAVWVSLASLQRVSEKGGFDIICILCASKRPELLSSRPEPPTPGQLREMAEELQRRREGGNA